MSTIIQRPDACARPIYCACGWTGKVGQLIAADKLRCPKCKGEEFGIVTPDVTTRVQ